MEVTWQGDISRIIFVIAIHPSFSVCWSGFSFSHTVQLVASLELWGGPPSLPLKYPGPKPAPLHLLGFFFHFSLTEKQTGNFIDCLCRFGVVLKTLSPWGLFGGARGPLREPMPQCREIGCWNPLKHDRMF